MLSGCTLKMAYNSLDFWLYYYLSDYIVLNSQQRTQLKQGLDTALLHHRKQELPRIHHILSQFQVDLQQPLTYQHIAHYHDAFRQVGKDSAMVFASPIIFSVQRMSDRQIDKTLSALKQDIDDRQAKRRAKTPQRRVDERYDKLHDKAEKWLGHVTSSQQALLLALAQQQIAQTAIYETIAYTHFSQLEKTVATRHAMTFKDAVESQLHTLIHIQDAQYQVQLDQYFALRFEILQQLNHSLSRQQLQHLQGELTDVRKDIAALIHSAS